MKMFKVKPKYHTESKKVGALGHKAENSDKFMISSKGFHHN